MKTVLAMIFSLGLIASSAHGDVVTISSSRPLDLRLPTVDSISEWAGKAYFGGHRKYEFARDSRKVVVIVGQPTSGLVSAEIVVFHRVTDGTYRVMLTRSRILAAIEVTEDANGISFSASTARRSEVLKEPLLLIPWTGVFTTAMN